MPSIAKELMLQELIETLESKKYIFFAQHRGLPANDFVELRRKLEQVADRTVVVKNSITRLAFKQMGVKEVDSLIKGSLFLTVAEKDPHVISKILVDFAKNRADSFELDGAYLEGNVFPTQYVKTLAELPPREVLLAQVVGGLNAPISGFVSGLGQLLRSLAVAIDQIRITRTN